MSRYWNDIYLVPDDELVHFGIKGQHWGIRRYQNKDGSLTAAGRRKYKKSSDGTLVKRSKEEIKKYDKQVKSLKKAAAQKKKNDSIRKKVADNNDLNLMAKNQKLFSSSEINAAVARSEALGKLNAQRRAKAAEAEKWLATVTSYATAAQTLYKAVASDEMQGAALYINKTTGANLPLLPNSYDNYKKIYGGVALPKKEGSK